MEESLKYEYHHTETRELFPVPQQGVLTMIKRIHVSISRSALMALAFAVFYFLVNYYWMRQNRFGGILDIDEAGYTGIAVNFARQLMGGGIGNWLRAFTFPNIQAPLSYAFASILMYFMGLSQNYGILASAIFGSITIFLTFLLSARLSSIIAAVVAAILVISNPDFTDYSRNFEFAAASAFSFIALAYFFEKSEGFGKALSSVACGGCLGLLLLSRTVNISFIPSIAFTSIIFSVIIRKEPWMVHIRNLFLALAATVLVAGPWYYINFKGVMGYLFSYGYGSHVAEYSISGGDRFFRMLQHGEALFARMSLPHAVLLCVAFLFLIAAVIFKRRMLLKDRNTLFSIYLVVLFLLCFGTLLTSDNTGSGFEVPLIPILAVGLSAGIARLVDSRRLKAMMAVATIVICCVAVVPLANDKICRRLAGSLGSQLLSGQFRLFSCGGTIFSYLHSGGLASDSKGVDRNTEKMWFIVNEQVNSKIDELNKAGKLVVFSSRHIVENINTAELWSMLNRGSFFPATQIDPAAIPDNIDGYKHWLAQEPIRDACVFIAETSSDGQFRPVPTYEYLQAAFEQTGFTKSATLPLPDNQQALVFWTRPGPACE